MTSSNEKNHTSQKGNNIWAHKDQKLCKVKYIYMILLDICNRYKRKKRLILRIYKEFLQINRKRKKKRNEGMYSFKKAE